MENAHVEQSVFDIPSVRSVTRSALEVCALSRAGSTRLIGKLFSLSDHGAKRGEESGNVRQRGGSELAQALRLSREGVT